MSNAGVVEFPISELLDLQPIEKTNSVLLDLGVVYPNGCYKPETIINFDDLENRNIFLLHKAKKEQGPCTMALVKIAISLELPIPVVGHYTLIDFVTKQILGKIVVTNEMTAISYNCKDFCN